MRFGPLPGAKQEVQEVASLWSSKLSRTFQGEDTPVRSLTGREASEAAFKRLAPGNQLLHLATHGYFVSGECPSGLEGSRGIGLLIAESGEPSETAADLVRARNPLLLSGLVLAGANRRGQAQPEEEDGILTAQEIAALDLTGVRWAVLSACETGAGEVLNGEGVFGLQRAFRIAGARTVVTSLWSVRDEATRHWMNAFYRAAVDRGLGTAEASREASRAVLRERRERGEELHPFYWGGFIATGS